MKNRNFAPMGSLHPILFFAVVYVVALLLSIFICSSLFYSFNSKSSTGRIENLQRELPANSIDVPNTLALNE